jgi:hypothetical protein
MPHFIGQSRSAGACAPGLASSPADASWAEFSTGFRDPDRRIRGPAVSLPGFRLDWKG